MFSTARLLALVAISAAFAGCATSTHWSENHSDKSLGVVRVSYEFPEFQEPSVSDDQATRIAVNRCEGWGFDDAQPIAGQLRQCSNMDNGDCDLWRVTREFQCTRSVAQASQLAR